MDGAGSSQSYDINPGPYDSSLLTLQSHHISDSIWRNNECDEVDVKRCDSAVWKLAVHPRVQQKLVEAGFYGVYKSGNFRIDHALVTALIERWRPETHTFHLPIGEATVTLQDIGVLWGLPIDGDPVTGIDEWRSAAEWRAKCIELFGVDLGIDAFDRNRMKLAPISAILKDHSQQLPNEATEVQCEQRARMYIILMLGGLLVADTSGNKMRTMFLDLIEDFDQIGSYSWGSAALATLYHGMCRSSKQGQLTISGPFTLLQMWAWERLTVFRPIIRENLPLQHLYHPNENNVDHPMPLRPRASRWVCHATVRNVSNFTLRVYRDQLDRLQSNQFIWQPYNATDIENLPDYCRQGEIIWLTKAPLICFHVVEYHYPDRVLRQFGMHQAIPTAPYPISVAHITITSRRSRSDTDYRVVHHDVIAKWEDRHGLVETANFDTDEMSFNDQYMQWYRRQTRLFIGKPEPHVVRDGYTGYATVTTNSLQTMQHIYHEAAEFLEGNENIEEIRERLSNWRLNIAARMHDAGEEWRLQSLGQRNDGEGLYQVTTGTHPPKLGGNVHIVNYVQRYCTCGKWSAYNIPCSHAIRVCREIRKNFSNLVAPEYSLNAYESIYMTHFMPLQHQDFWSVPHFELYANPERLRSYGRGQNTNARIHNEMDISDVRRRRQCSRCKEQGHDVRQCPQRNQSG